MSIGSRRRNQFCAGCFLARSAVEKFGAVTSWLAPAARAVIRALAGGCGAAVTPLAALTADFFLWRFDTCAAPAAWALVTLAGPDTGCAWAVLNAVNATDAMPLNRMDLACIIAPSRRFSALLAANPSR